MAITDALREQQKKARKKSEGQTTDKALSSLTKEAAAKAAGGTAGIPAQKKPDQLAQQTAQGSRLQEAIRKAGQTTADRLGEDPELARYKEEFATATSAQARQLARLKMARREANLRGDHEEANRLAMQQRALEIALSSSDIFNERIRDSVDRATDAFGLATDIAVARQVRGVESRAGALIDRLGLSGGLAAQSIVAAEAALGGLGIEKMTSFDAQMQTIFQAQQAGFLQNQFNFFTDMVRMRFQTDMEKELATHRAELQKDINRQQAWYQALTTIGGGLFDAFTGLNFSGTGLNFSGTSMGLSGTQRMRAGQSLAADAPGFIPSF